jgi:hypothetical protein
MRQIILAKGHERNKSYTVSAESKKQHISHPFKFCLAKLSFVNNNLVFINHMKILILSGSFLTSIDIYIRMSYDRLLYPST